MISAEEQGLARQQSWRNRNHSGPLVWPIQLKHAAIPLLNPTTNHGGSCARFASRSFSNSPQAAENRAFQ